MATGLMNNMEALEEFKQLIKKENRTAEDYKRIAELRNELIANGILKQRHS